MVLDGRTVLLIEDDMLILQDLKVSLTRQGAKVISETSLEGGLVAAEQTVDAAILDILLGDEDVLPIAMKLSDKDVPLIFHSAVADQEDVAKAFPDARCLSKPVREATLIDAVRDATQ